MKIPSIKDGFRKNTLETFKLPAVSKKEYGLSIKNIEFFPYSGCLNITVINSLINQWMKELFN